MSSFFPVSPFLSSFFRRGSSKKQWVWVGLGEQTLKTPFELLLTWQHHCEQQKKGERGLLQLPAPQEKTSLQDLLLSWLLLGSGRFNPKGNLGFFSSLHLRDKPL